MDDQNQVDPHYMESQGDICHSMRTILVDWLVSVQWTFQLSPATLYGTVHLIDSYLSHHQVCRAELQLVGAAALLVTSEKEEIFPLHAQELVFLCDGAFAEEEILDTSDTVRAIMKSLGHFQTSHSYLKEEFLEQLPATLELIQLSQFILESTLLCGILLRHSPRKLAAASLWIARCSVETSFRKTRKACMGFTKSDLTATARDILVAYFTLNSAQETSQERNLRALNDKYSADAFYDGLVQTDLRCN